jgi:hypothetical protein
MCAEMRYEWKLRMNDREDPRREYEEMRGRGREYIYNKSCASRRMTR